MEPSYNAKNQYEEQKLPNKLEIIFEENNINTSEDPLFNLEVSKEYQKEDSHTLRNSSLIIRDLNTEDIKKNEDENNGNTANKNDKEELSSINNYSVNLPKHNTILSEQDVEENKFNTQTLTYDTTKKINDMINGAKPEIKKDEKIISNINKYNNELLTLKNLNGNTTTNISNSINQDENEKKIENENRTIENGMENNINNNSNNIMNNLNSTPNKKKLTDKEKLNSPIKKEIENQNLTNSIKVIRNSVKIKELEKIKDPDTISCKVRKKPKISYKVKEKKDNQNINNNYNRNINSYKAKSKKEVFNIFDLLRKTREKLTENNNNNNSFKRAKSVRSIKNQISIRNNYNTQNNTIVANNESDNDPHSGNISVGGEMKVNKYLLSLPVNKKIYRNENKLAKFKEYKNKTVNNINKNNNYAKFYNTFNKTHKYSSNTFNQKLELMNLNYPKNKPKKFNSKDLRIIKNEDEIIGGVHSTNDKKISQANYNFYRIPFPHEKISTSSMKEKSLENKIFQKRTPLRRNSLNSIYEHKKVTKKKGRSLDKLNPFLNFENNNNIVSNTNSKRMLNPRQMNINNTPLTCNNRINIAYIKKSPNYYTANNYNTNANKNKNKCDIYSLNNYDLNNNIESNLNNNFLINTKRNNSGSDRKTFTMKSNQNNNDRLYFDERRTMNNINTNLYYNLRQHIQKTISLNIEDLLIFEEKFYETIMSLKETKKADDQCFDVWNYYYNCSLYQKLEKIFTNEEDSQLVQISINYCLLSILLCYEFSFNKEEMNKVYILILEILQLSHKNLMTIYEHILNKIYPMSWNNPWVMYLKEIIKSSQISDDIKTNNNYNSMTTIDKIVIFSDNVSKKIRNLLLNHKINSSNLIYFLFSNISTKSYDEINDFFVEYILRVENYDGCLSANIFLKSNPQFRTVSPPYLRNISHKSYSLVLDLDETLVSFKVANEKKGFVRTRPYLFDFLEQIGRYYEIILFTSALQSYANSIITAIEYDRKYFDYVFYRQHCIIIGNDFVKDLNRIGRPLDSTIIVDNMPQNFKLQKENGIVIKSFWGQDSEDSALLNLLPILIEIAESGGDVRIELVKYRDEIAKNVTSSIYKNNIL